MCPRRRRPRNGAIKSGDCCNGSRRMPTPRACTSQELPLPRRLAFLPPVPTRPQNLVDARGGGDRKEKAKWFGHLGPGPGDGPGLRERNCIDRQGSTNLRVGHDRCGRGASHVSYVATRSMRARARLRPGAYSTRQHVEKHRHVVEHVHHAVTHKRPCAQRPQPGRQCI
jgi:hypothetical protein